jgi:tryptophan-rich sensory protein
MASTVQFISMKLSRMLDPRGTKYAYLGLAMLLNIGWALLFFSLMDSMMLRYGELMQGVDTTLMLGIFLGALTIGFLVTLLAKDRRGPTYGVYGGLAGLVVIVLMTWKSGLLAPLVGFMAVFGGINGGTMGEMYQQIQRKKNRK